MSDRGKVILGIGFLLMWCLVVGFIALGEVAEGRDETEQMKACVASGNAWVTRPVLGHPDNHDCVRRP